MGVVFEMLRVATKGDDKLRYEEQLADLRERVEKLSTRRRKNIAIPIDAPMV